MAVLENGWGGAVPVDAVEGLAAPLHASATKRALDVIGATVALLALLPVLLVAAAAVYATDRGPVLFRQVRVGADGRHFSILKFRSMRCDAERILESDTGLRSAYLANNCKLRPEQDHRLTPIGRVLRASSLDELPQLLNVLKGDMSLVGPRPVLPLELVERYGSASTYYQAARPGITGAWQVSGRSTVEYPERVALDVAYVETWSLLADLRILARTPGAVLRADGAY